jgi:hypothetical protein
MRSPAELDRVQWHALTHADGSAEDVPELIKALYESDGETADEVLYDLYDNIYHQGTVYSASAPAVPFLAHAVRHAPNKRAELLMFLAVLADHDPADVDLPHWPSSSVAAVCVELCQVLPELLFCLKDTERGVRRAALRVVAAVAELLPAEQRVSAMAQLDAVAARPVADGPAPSGGAGAPVADRHRPGGAVPPPVARRLAGAEGPGKHVCTASPMVKAPSCCPFMSGCGRIPGSPRRRRTGAQAAPADLWRDGQRLRFRDVLDNVRLVLGPAS